MQERVKEMEERQSRYTAESWVMERTRLKGIIDDKNQQLDMIKRDEEAHRDHIETLRREVMNISFSFGFLDLFIFFLMTMTMLRTTIYEESWRISIK